MAKPSIFSKDYERHKKRRKRIVASAVVLLLAAAGIFLVSGSIKDKVISKASAYKNIKLFSAFKKGKQGEASPSSTQEKPAPKEEGNTAPPVVEVEEKGYDIPLSNGIKIKAVYENRDGENKFKYILPAEAAVSFNINPSGSAMVIMDALAQSMVLVDINGNIQDITNTKYTYTNSEENKTTVFKKEEVLEKYKQNNYVWCTTPKFIDNENIAYLSQLPFVSSKKKEKFFWAVNIKNKDKHFYKYALNGENLKLGNASEKGIELILDNGSVKYVKLADGEIKVYE